MSTKIIPIDSTEQQFQLFSVFTLKLGLMLAYKEV